MSRFESVIESLYATQKVWLVTGCAGFIGSNIIEFLLTHNQKVVGLDNFSTGYQKNIDAVLALQEPQHQKNFRFIKANTWDLKSCIDACRGVDIVLHQAALGSVPRSIEDPITSNQSNITGFLNMLIASKDMGVDRFVYASSSSVYGDSQELPKVEQRVGKLLSPYAVMKMTNELYADVFYKTYGLETIGLRYFNVFGRRQDPKGAYSAVIPKWVSSLLNKEEIFINGDGETSRDFTYIDNVVQMNILAGLSPNQEAFGEVFNVAVGGRNTLNELYEIISQNLSQEIDSFVHSKPIYREFRDGDIRHSNADITKAKTVLGYQPTHDIYRGMREAIRWYIGEV